MIPRDENAWKGVSIWEAVIFSDHLAEGGYLLNNSSTEECVCIHRGFLVFPQSNQNNQQMLTQLNKNMTARGSEGSGVSICVTPEADKLCVTMC